MATKSTKKPAAKKPAAKKPTAAKKPAAAKKPVAAKKPAAPKKPAAAKKPVTTKPAVKPTAAKKTLPKKTSSAPMATRAMQPIDVRELDFTPYQIVSTEDYMNAPMLKHFEHILRAWKQALMEQVDETVTHLQDEPGNLADPSDRATQEEEFNLELRTRDRERKLISKIDTALNQIKHNDYGYCHQCGEEIGIRRLEARPTATLCIDCKTLSEIREKHYSG
jgi:DnaK suppressor protein